MEAAAGPVGSSPYRLEDPPGSVGRVLLSRGFEQYCLLHWGLSAPEIADAFAGGGGEHDRERVRIAARLLGGVLAHGAVRAWTRPIGGGEPTPLRASTWELDDFTRRFAASALDPARPFDRDASPTHWIFVDLEDWNGMMEASIADLPPRRRRPHVVDADRAGAVEGGDGVATPVERSQTSPETLLRLPEVLSRTGMSRSTLYRKMDAGRFPRGEAVSENITAWRESAVSEWIARPT